MDLVEFAKLSGTVFAISMAVSFIEMLYLTVISKKESFVHAYGQPLKNAVFVGVLENFLPVFSTVAFAVLGSHVAPLSLGNNWYVWPIGLLIIDLFQSEHVAGMGNARQWELPAPGKML